MPGEGWCALQEDDCQSGRKGGPGRCFGEFRQFQAADALQSRRQAVPVADAYELICRGLPLAGENACAASWESL